MSAESAPKSGLGAMEAESQHKLDEAREAERVEAARLAAEAKVQAAAQAEANRIAAEKQADVDRVRREQRAQEHRAKIAEARRSEPSRVNGLNDKAQLEIFGSKGRTYFNPGSKDVIADADHILPGKLDEIRNDRSISTKQGEREAAADVYVQNVEYLVDKGGLELSQAKLLLDLDEVRKTSGDRLYKKLLGEYITTMPDSEARAKATAKVAARERMTGGDTDFVYQIIKEKHLYSRADYDKFIKSDQYKQILKARQEQVKNQALADAKEDILNDMSQRADRQAAGAAERAERQAAAAAEQAAQNAKRSHPSGKRHAIEDTPIRPVTDEESEEAKELRQEEMARLQEYRDEYLRRVAGHGRRAFHLKREFRKGSVADAQADYEVMRDDILSSEIGHLRDLGVSDKDIEMITAAVAFGEQRTLAKRLHEMRLAASGNHKIVNRTRKAEHSDAVAEWSETEQVKKGPIGRQMNKFYEWFGRVDDSKKRFGKHTVAKGAVLAGVGVAAGLALAPVTGALVAGVGGGVLVSRITKAYMSTHLRKKGEDAHSTHSDARRKELLDALRADKTGNFMTDLIAAQMGKEVRRNQKRTAIGLGSVAIGFAGGELLHGLAGYDGIGFKNPLGGHSENHTATHTPQPAHQPTHQDVRHGKVIHHKPEHNPGHLDKHVDVKAGEGYTQVFHDEFAAQGVKLTPQQSFDMYQHMADKFPGGKFFANDPSYRMADGNFGITNAGPAMLRPEVLHELNHYAEENGLLKKTS